MNALYRFYLYTVFILFSIYATYTCTTLLSTLLSLTPMHASYETVPSANDVVQAITLAIVSFVVILLIGGLHYWLIRRDLARNVEAAASPIRSFFLTITEGIAAALGLPTLGYVLLNLASSNPISLLLAFALSTLALALLIELERRRIVSPPRRATTVFLHIHTYGVQAVLLIVLGTSWSRILLPIIDGLFWNWSAQAENCGISPCSHDNLFLLALAGLWFTGTWLFYGWLTSRDSSRFLRFTLHGLGFAVGISIFLVGLYNAFNVLLLFLFHEPAALSTILDMGGRYDFVGPLTLGLLVTSMYHVWMRTGVRRGLLPTQANFHLIELSIISVLTAITFWWGMGNLFYNTFALLFKLPQPIDIQSWTSAEAFVLAGCISIAIEFYLQRKNRSQPEIASGPRRAQVLALLAIGTLTLSVAIATTLYIGLTTLLKSPIANGTQLLSFGLAALLVGLLLTGFYLYTALNERQFGHTTRPTPATPGTPEPIANTTPQTEPVTTPSNDTVQLAPVAASTPEPTTIHTERATIELILNQLLASEITRAEASAKLYDLMQVPDTHKI